MDRADWQLVSVLLFCFAFLVALARLSRLERKVERLEAEREAHAPLIENPDMEPWRRG